MTRIISPYGEENLKNLEKKQLLGGFLNYVVLDQVGGSFLKCDHVKEFLNGVDDRKRGGEYEYDQ